MDERVYPPFRQRFLGRVCQFKFLMYMLLIFQLLLLLLTSVSHFTVDLPPESQAIVNLNFILLGGLLVLTVGMLILCGQYQSQDKLIGWFDRD